MAPFPTFMLAVAVLVLTLCTLGFGGVPTPPSTRYPSPPPYGRNVPSPDKPSPYKQPSPHEASPPYRPSQTGSYGSGLPYVPPGGAYRQNPYQGAPSTSYSNGGYNQQSRGGPPAGRPQDEEDEELEKEFTIVDTVAQQLNVAAQLLANADSQQSLETKGLITFPTVDFSDFLQDQQLDDIEAQLSFLEEAIANLSATLDNVEAQNAQNAEDINDLDKRLVDVQLTDSTQVRKIAALLTGARNLKPKLFTIVKNSFALLTNQILNVAAQINATGVYVNSRGCETGVVTLSSDDRRAVVLFNTDFNGVVPQIVYGVVGIRNKFHTEPAPAPAYPPKGYGERTYDGERNYFGEPKSPTYSSVEGESIFGVTIVAFATSESITIELVDRSFNGSELQTVEVSWQACSVGPGTVLRRQ